jgi:hypothetical protein
LTCAAAALLATAILAACGGSEATTADPIGRGKNGKGGDE